LIIIDLYRYRDYAEECGLGRVTVMTILDGDVDSFRRTP